MTDNESFDHFIKKVYEVLHLHLKHYMPVGKPEPLYYRDVLYEVYKIYDSGVLEELSKEPIMSEEVKQLDLLSYFFSDKTVNLSGDFTGTLFESKKDENH